MRNHRVQTRARREKLRDFTRHEILTAASRVFARGGFESATMNEIAEAAGFSAASLYTYFPSKDAIYVALIEHVTAELEAPLDAPVSGKAPFAERLETLLSVQLQVLARHLDVFVLMMQPTSSHGSAEAQRRARDSGLPRMLARYERWLEKNSTARERGNLPPRRLALAINGVGQAFGMERMMVSPGQGFDGLAGEIVEMVLYGVKGRPS